MSPPKILIIGPAWVGDMVMAHSLLKALKRDHPNAHLTVLAPAWSIPLAERMPEVTESSVLPFQRQELGIRKRWLLGRSLRNQGYTQAIVLPNSFKSAWIPWLAGIPQRTGWLGE